MNEQEMRNHIEKQNVDKKYISFKKVVASFVKTTIAYLFPGYYDIEYMDGVDDINKNEDKIEIVKKILRKVLLYVVNDNEIDDNVAIFIKKLPIIYEYSLMDIFAGYCGDPAALNPDEIILSYPAFFAIITYRFAHELYVQKIPTLPRVMTEYAHAKTGIDIHPGATIGKYFFIDHGTGVVIGETTTIGDNVKLYQHVTLGAKSFSVNEDGSLVKGIKRHPDVGNNVVIYSGATILGGDTKIGDDCVIGANVWVTHSVEAGTKVVVNK